MDVQGWVQARLPSDVLHLDAAAVGRVSQHALVAQVQHLQAEADGGYVAEARAEPLVTAGRAALAGLVGLGAADVAFSESASAAFAGLLQAWPLAPGARVGTVPSQYGANARVLTALAAARSWELVVLPVDALGRVQDVPARLDLLALPHVASQRGVVQPAQQLRDSGVPLVLDVAQSLGQTPVPPGCAAYVGTSRKWLCGPRGVGFAVVAPAWESRLADPPAALERPPQGGARRLESSEANVAGRVGLAVAVQQWTPELLPVVHASAARLRGLLSGSPWTVVEPVEERTGITTLVPPPGLDPVRVRDAMLSRGIVVSAVPVTRAEDLPTPVLRISTAAWLAPADVDALVEVLAAVST